MFFFFFELKNSFWWNFAGIRVGLVRDFDMVNFCEFYGNFQCFESNELLA